MQIYNLSDFKKNWFIGNFEPTLFSTKEFEIGYSIHKKGSYWPKHYHKIAKEINLLIKGKEKINGQIIESGQIFVIEPGEVVEPEFLEDCEVLVIKIPSVPGDKYEC